MKETEIEVSPHGNEVLVMLKSDGGGFTRGTERKFIVLSVTEATGLRDHIDATLQIIRTTKKE
jgi:hypothetical protein